MQISNLTENQKLVLDTINMNPTKGIPGGAMLNPMEWTIIDRMAGEPEGTYQKNPKDTYIKMLKNSSSCMVDQWLWNNPLTMRAQGYGEDSEKRNCATTGAKEVIVNGIKIDSPEKVVEHLEHIVIPDRKKSMVEFNEQEFIKQIGEREQQVQNEIGDTMLKIPHAIVKFPGFMYSLYGYENYFMAYALYPEVIEKYFSVEADYLSIRNRAVVKAYDEYQLPRYVRLDHDMADGRGTLASIESLDRLWLPYFTRAIEPVAKTDIKMIWHSDGNLMQLYPRLIEAGIRGFQGFQYEDGMDYEKICAMKTRDGENLLIIAGVSVTQTLPHGSPDDVKREMKYLVEKGPETGLFLGCSSSMAPGVPWENIKVLMEGFKYYRENGRG